MESNIFTYEQLLAAGQTPSSIREALEQESLVRLRRGWYAREGASREVMSALKAGAYLGCLSGCKYHGLWVPSHTGVHAVYGSGRKPRARPGVTLHRFGAPAPASPVWPLEDCLAQVIRRHDVETSLIVVESAVEKRFITQDEAESFLKRTPHGDLRRYLARARSGSETRVRLFFQLRGVPVKSLVVIKGVGEVDLRVGSRLIVECDSEAHHTSEAARYTDATRDLNSHLSYYDRIRLAYRQIWHHWPATQVGLSAVLKQRRHLYRKRPSSAVTPRGLTRAQRLGLPLLPLVNDIELEK